MSLAALIEAAGQARFAGPADTVGGQQARYVAAPGDVEHLCALLARCAAEGLTVVPRGDGSKLDWAHPPSRVDVLLDTGRLAGVREHSVGDFVVTVGAGTPVRALQATLALAGQRLAVDPPSAGATVGGMLAAGEAGPLANAFGTPRDLLIGVEFGRADGSVGNSGGRVRKNLSGYDLGRLLCGSYGTLGVLATATFRLHPVPARRAFVLRSVHTPSEVAELVGDLVDSTLAPAAIEVDLPQDSPRPVPRQRDRSGPAGAGRLAVLFEGSTVGVPARVRAAVDLLGGDAMLSDEPPPWWGRYPFDGNDVGLRLVAPVAGLHAAIYALGDVSGAAVPVRGSAGIGVVHAALPGTLPVDRVAAILDAVRTTLIARGGSCVVLCAPAALRTGLDLWGPVPGLDLMRRVKDQFDPDRMLAPGRFVGGI